MTQFIDKLRKIEEEITTEKGSFLLFALFLRDDAPNVWDLLVSAPWIEEDNMGALRYISKKLNDKLTEDEILNLSKIVIIDQSNPGLEAITKAVNIQHGLVEIKDSDFFGLQIKHAQIITSGSIAEITHK
jgi:hypothetical protein